MREPKKAVIMTLVERDGQSRSFHVANVKAKTLRETIVKVASHKSYLMTDELASYEKVGKEFPAMALSTIRPTNMCASADSFKIGL
jgi:ISXO2-like transposase domain